MISVKSFTPMVKRETDDGKTEILEAQPFLICQTLDEQVTSQPRSQPKRKSSQLQIPNLLSKLRRASKSSSMFSGDASSPNDPESPSDVTLMPSNGNTMRTRASICFVPMGQSISDPENPDMDWTPLHGFLYSSFMMARRPSYKQACMESTGSPSPPPVLETSNSDEHIIIVPSRKTFMRSLSQPESAAREGCDVCVTDVADARSTSQPCESTSAALGDDENDALLHTRSRKASRVSFQLAPNDADT